MLIECMYCKKDISNGPHAMSNGKYYCYPTCSAVIRDLDNTQQGNIQQVDTFNRIIKECQRIHDIKNHDYAMGGNTYSNFERAAIIASWFKNDVDKTFAVMIGIKLARLAELRNGKTPKNESILDTGIDMSNYSIIWTAFIEDNRIKKFADNEKKIISDILSKQDVKIEQGKSTYHELPLTDTFTAIKNVSQCVYCNYTANTWEEVQAHITECPAIKGIK